MFGLLGRDSVARLLSGDLTVTDFYNRLYMTVALFTLTLLIVSLIGDVAGHNWINLVLIPVWALVAIWLKFYPRTIVATLALSSAAYAAGITPNLKKGFETWDRFMNHFALFGGVFGLTRFLVPIKSYPFMGLLLLGALITLGLWAWVYKAGTAYRRYVLWLVLIALAIGLYGVLTGKPKAATHEVAADASTEQEERFEKFWNDLFYEQTFDLEVTTLEGGEICGVRPGKRKFELVSVVDGKGLEQARWEVMLMTHDVTENTDITSVLRVNNRHLGEKTTVGECVRYSFKLPPETKRNPIVPRLVILKAT